LTFGRKCGIIGLQQRKKTYKTKIVSAFGGRMIKLAKIIDIVETAKPPVCFNCDSKIYPGETIYIIDNERYCEECVEVTECEDFEI
jgi:hypothetical protein